MKRTRTIQFCRLIAILVVGACLVLIASCGEADPDPFEQAIKKITAHTWKSSNVTVDGAIRTDLFAGFTIRFNENGTFTSTNGEPVWPASGTWGFTGSDATTMNSGGAEIQVQELTDATLVLSFQWSRNTYGGGRLGSVSGRHVFSLTK